MRKGFILWAVTIPILFIFLESFTTLNPVDAAEDRAAPPSANYAVVPNGTHFLVRLEDELSTGKSKINKKFTAKTLDPLEAPSGYVIAPGAKIRGHISRIEPGGITGRARLWLTFDDLDTHHGRLPLVAIVSTVPGDFSVRPGESKEGEIEARTSTGRRDIEAAAAGAAMGASRGASRGGGKEVAIGAASGAVAGYLASSGIGQELVLPKGTKLDLVLDRPLYLD